MKVYNYQPSFRGINDFFKKSNETVFDKNAENKQTVKNSFEKENKFQKIKDSKYTTTGVGIVAVIATLAGIKKIFSKPTKADKKLAQILDKRLEMFDSSIKDFQDTCKDLYYEAINDLKKLPEKKIFTYDSSKTNAKLAPARNNAAILKAEDELFNDVDTWFTENLQKVHDTDSINNAGTIAFLFNTKIYDKHTAILNNKEISSRIEDIPEQLRKSKKAEKMLNLFFEEWKTRANKLQNSSDYTKNLFLEDERAYTADKYTEAGDLLQAKYSEQEKIIQKMKDRIPPINLIQKFGKTEAEIPEMPSSIPESISSNQIVKFILKKDKTKEDYTNFAENMGENLTLKDLNIFNERLKIRTALSDSENDKRWCQKVGGHIEVLEEKVKKILSDKYMAPINDVETINSRDAEMILETFRKKIGCKSIGDIRSEIFERHTAAPLLINSGMEKLYEKNKKNFTENFSSLVLNIERSNKNLFDWGHINEYII